MPGFELPEAVRVAQQQFDAQAALHLDAMADRMESNKPEERGSPGSAFERLQQTISACLSEKPKETVAASLRALTSLSRKTETLTRALDNEI